MSNFYREEQFEFFDGEEYAKNQVSLADIARTIPAHPSASFVDLSSDKTIGDSVMDVAVLYTGILADAKEASKRDELSVQFHFAPAGEHRHSRKQWLEYLRGREGYMRDEPWYKKLREIQNEDAALIAEEKRTLRHFCDVGGEPCILLGFNPATNFCLTIKLKSLQRGDRDELRKIIYSGAAQKALYLITILNKVAYAVAGTTPSPAVSWGDVLLTLHKGQPEDVVFAVSLDKIGSSMCFEQAADWIEARVNHTKGTGTAAISEKTLKEMGGVTRFKNGLDPARSNLMTAIAEVGTRMIDAGKCGSVG